MKQKHHRFTNKTGFLTVRGDSESGGRYKSKLEKSGFIRYLMNPAVKWVKLQEPRIRYVDARGKNRRYTADLLVTWHNESLCPLAIETKYQKELKRRPELALKFGQVRAAFAKKGIKFIVLTDREIFAPDIEMMRFIFDYRNNTPSRVEEDILTVVRRHGEVLLGNLLAAVAGGSSYEQALLAPAVWRLVSTHQLRVDFQKILDSTAKITVPPAI